MITDEEQAGFNSLQPTKEEDDAMWAEFARLEAIEAEKLKQIGLRIKELRGAKFFYWFEQYIQMWLGQGSIHGWEMTTEKPLPKRRKQQIDDLAPNSYINSEWCHQYCDGGMEGDSFSGQVWIHIKGNRYFTTHYSM